MMTTSSGSRREAHCGWTVAVVARRSRGRHEALADVLLYPPWIALRRLAVAAAAGVEDLDHLAGCEIVTSLRMHIPSVHEIFAQGAGRATAHAQRRKVGPRAHDIDRERMTGVVANDDVLT